MRILGYALLAAVSCSTTPVAAPAPELIPAVAVPSSTSHHRAPAGDFLWMMFRVRPDADQSPAFRQPEPLCDLLAHGLHDHSGAELASGLVDQRILEWSVVQIGPDGVRYAGRRAVPLVDGVVPEAERRGQMLVRLYDRLLESSVPTRRLLDLCVDLGHADAAFAGPGARVGRVLVLAEPSTPWATLRDVLYTLDRVQVEGAWLGVGGAEGLGPVGVADWFGVIPLAWCPAWPDGYLPPSACITGFGESGPGIDPDGFGAIVGGIPQAQVAVVDDEVIVGGALEKADIDALVRRSINQIRYCYHRELSGAPGLAGQVDLRVSIDGSGATTTVAVERSTMSHESLESCLVGRFARMSFPAPADGKPVRVIYPLSFAPGDG